MHTIKNLNERKMNEKKGVFNSSLKTFRVAVEMKIYYMVYYMVTQKQMRTSDAIYIILPV